MKLTDVVASYGDLLPEPAGHYAEIVRLNAPDFRPSVESFDLTGGAGESDDESQAASSGYRADFQPSTTLNRRRRCG